MRSQRPPLRRTPALPRSSGNSMAKHVFTPDVGYSCGVRTGIYHNNWKGDRSVDNVCDRHADLTKFIFDIYVASNRTRMFTRRPRAIGISEQGSF